VLFVEKDSNKQEVKQDDKSKNIQNIYFFFTVGLLLFGLVMFIFTAVNIQVGIINSVVIAEFSQIVLFYHLPHFIIGIVLLFVFINAIKKKLTEMKLYKTIAGIIFTPISGIIYLAVMLLAALSSCS
jgi:FtsH-binding integral membrane protein